MVKIKIHPGYHLYAYVAQGDPFIQTEISITLPEGYEKTGEILMPSYGYYNDNGTTVYTDEIIFKQEISGKGAGEAVCYLTWQCCDAHACLMPVIKRPFSVKIP